MNLLLRLLLGAALGQSPAERSLLAEIEQYDTQIGALDGQISTLDAEAEATRVRLAQHAAEAGAAETELAARRDGTVREVQSFYRLKRKGILRMILESEDPLDLRRRVRYLLALIEAEQARQVAYGALLATREAEETRAATEQEALTRLRTELDTRRTQLESERAHRRNLLATIRGTPALSAQANAEKRTAAADLAASVATREASAPAATAEPEAAQFRAAKGRLPMPVGGSVTGAFGPSSDPVTGEQVQNLGIDISAPLGTPFRAVFGGTVTRSGYVRGYGQMVMVAHGNYATLYAHANGLRAIQGQQVHAGDVLGLVGTTGLTEDAPPRLHFEIRYNGTPQDPLPWLAR